MKTKIISIILLSWFILVFTGCEEEVLEKKARTIFSDQDVWNDISLARMFQVGLYNGLGDWGIGFDAWKGLRALPGVATDEAFANWDWGTRTWGSTWIVKYEYIRKCNIFLSNIDDIKVDEKEKKILKGEVKYLRAHFYFELISYFGGVPLITDVFGLDDEFKLSRTPYEEVVDWIEKELNEAKEMVPETRNSADWGKVTKGACLALKSNLLLYANSKLHDVDTEPSGPLYDYKKDTWQEVADAAKAVIDMPHYSLQEVETWEDYNNIFVKQNPEIIFAKAYHKDYGGLNARIEYVNGPMSQGGWGNNVPIHNLVDDFQMENGKYIYEDESGYNSSPDLIYSNRELRFYANILYQGAQYKGQDLEYFLPGGVDSRDGATASNASRSGYNLRKLMNENVAFKNERSETPWIFLRLAEMYLNYAEAQYNMGNEAEARKYINFIRNRVHLPDINSSGEALLRDIQHERRIELAFEYHRFFDVRRWMIADVVENENAMGIQWKKVDENGNIDSNGELTYEIVSIQERNFFPRMYYLPIPIGEIEKAGLEQNAGY